MSTILDPKTPEEFIEYHYNKLKTDLNVYDIQINKVGFLGYFLNLMGWLSYDLKNFYDSLFVEAFVATAQTDKNLYLHSSFYRYIPSFAISSSVVANIDFNFNLLPNKTSNIVKREINFVTNGNMEFNIDSYNFTIESEYKFIDKTGGYSAIVTTPTGRVLQIPFPTSNISVPIYNCYQYNTLEYILQIPKYDLGSHYSYSFSIEKGFINDIKVQIYNKISDKWEDYDVKYVKYFESGHSKVVFLRKLSPTDFLLEFGSGVKGFWVSQMQARIIVKSTDGTSGNLLNNVLIPIKNTSLQIIDYKLDQNDDLIIADGFPLVLNPTKYLKVSFDHSENGKDPSSGDDLREDLIKYVETYDNMLSRNDFYNTMEKYLTDFKFLFKKINVFDNTFYMCKVFRDKYQNVLQTITYVDNVLDHMDKPNVIISSESEGILTEGVYYYVVTALDKYGESKPSSEINIFINGISETSIKLSWDSLENASSYRIYGRLQAAQDRYWETTELFFDDDGSNVNYTLSSVKSDYYIYPSIYRPVFTIESTDFISPFLYKYNPIMGWFEAYILYNFLYIYFSRTEISTDFPLIFLNVIYDGIKTYIRLKSYKDISDYTFKISINEVAVNEVDMTYKDINTFEYEYNNIFESSIQISIKGYEDEVQQIICVTDSFYQIKDITDQLVLPRYISSSGNNYIIGFPVMEKTIFDIDQHFYLDKLYDFIIGNNLKENRMICDTVRVAFLNSFKILSPILESITKQHGEILSDYNNLNSVKDKIIEPVIFVVNNDRFLVDIDAIDEFAGHDNEIAVYDKNTTSYNFIQPSLNDSVIVESTNVGYIFDGSNWFANFDLTLPLRISIQIKVDQNYVITNSINLINEKEDMLLRLSQELQQNYTGVDINFYNSQIVDFIHNNRPYIKSVSVNVTDSALRSLNNGIESKEEDDEILIGLKDKVDIVKYIPVFWYWNVDSIGLTIMT